MTRKVILFLSLLLSSVICHPSSAYAGTLIRDAEIEHTLRLFADPIFTAAGLDPQAVHLYIVGDDAINAYVAGGQNIFLHTGLLLACDDPTMLLGVIAHETGHIAGGHLARGSEDLRNAGIGEIIGFILGAAAAAGGGGSAGAAVLTGTQNVLGRKMLAYTRAHEQSADQAALRILTTLGVSASGMIKTFDLLRRDEQLHLGKPDPYMVTHPLSSERISTVRAFVEHSEIPVGQHPQALDMPLARMRAKLFSFLNIPPKTFARYPANDSSLPARMARAIAWYKFPDSERATAEMQALLKAHPKDPYLYDLYGQILFESGQISQALTAYENAAKLAPNSPLIFTSLGQAQLASNQLDAAIISLERATRLDSNNPQTWRFLAIAYGKKGNDSMTALSLAEEALLINKPLVAIQQANAAQKALTKGSPAYLRTEDLKRQAEDMRKRERDARNDDGPLP